MAALAAPIRTADMDPQDIAELLKAKMLKAKLSREQVNKLKPPSLTEKDQVAGGGSIYAQALLRSTKREIEDRKLNQDVYTSGVARSVYGEVELINYGPCLVEAHQAEMRRHQANKEVFTPDIYRSVYDRGEKPNYAKCLVESQHAESIRQEGNKGAHSGDIFRNLYGDATAATAEVVNACAQCPKCLEQKNLKQKAIQQENYLRLNIERQQKFVEQNKQKEAARMEAQAQHEKYQKQVAEANADPRIARLCNATVTGI